MTNKEHAERMAVSMMSKQFSDALTAIENTHSQSLTSVELHMLYEARNTLTKLVTEIFWNNESAGV